MKRIAVINLGSTSTKVAYFENDTCKFSESIPHPAQELSGFASNWEQYGYRRERIVGLLQQHGVAWETLDAVVSRGGHTQPIHSGVYRITPKMLEQSRSMKYGNHASDLGIRIAYDLAKDKNFAFVVDSPCTDEFEPLARYSGLPEMPRQSRFHVLNHKACARAYCKEHGLKYDEVNLVVAHMGGGTSVAAHKKGKLVDGDNGLDGDGPFSTNRTGALPVGALVDACYSGKYTHQEMRRKLNGLGCMMAYVNDNDVLSVYKKGAAGDKACMEVIDAMVYQTAKEIGAMATVLNGDVNAILLTGGIANDAYITSELKKRVGFIAPVYLYPGEREMLSLGQQVYYALIGKEEVFEL